MKRELFLIGIVVVLMVLLYRSCENAETSQRMYEATADSLRYQYDMNGSQIASIKVLEANNEKSMIEMATKDSTIQWLQSVVKDYKGKLKHALVVGNQSNSHGATRTIVIPGDTIEIEGQQAIFPIYETHWENEWERGQIRASKDSVHRVIQIRNEFEITQGQARNGWFKPREYEVNIKNLNPNTITTEMRSYSLKSDPKRVNFGIHAGYGLDLMTFKPVFYGGVGVSYTILSIK